MSAQRHRFPLAGSVALVTGGAQGIGFAITRLLGAQGARVAVADLRGAQEAAEKLAADGVTAIGLDGDVADEEAVASWVATVVDTFGGLDVLVNNASIYTSLAKRPFTEIDMDEWRRVFEVNVIGTAVVTRAVAEIMKERGRGRIVTVTSATVFKGTPLLAHYVASKGAVTALTRVLASELGPHGITANAVAPGFTLSDGVLSADADLEARTRAAHGQRALTTDILPDDIAATVVHLAGPGGAAVTGQTVVVDAGTVYH